MRAYACIKDGGIIQCLQELPFTFNGISRFRSLTAEQQAEQGVVPVVNVTPPYDPALFTEGEIENVAVFPDRAEISYVLRAAPPAPTPDELLTEQIVAIERAYPITHRFSRETTLVVVQALQLIAAKVNALDVELAALNSRVADPMPTLDPPPYGAQVVAQVDAEIVTLREQLP
jgi:hypothetical protein